MLNNNVQATPHQTQDTHMVVKGKAGKPTQDNTANTPSAKDLWKKNKAKAEQYKTVCQNKKSSNCSEKNGPKSSDSSETNQAKQKELKASISWALGKAKAYAEKGDVALMNRRIDRAENYQKKLDELSDGVTTVKKLLDKTKMTNEIKDIKKTGYANGVDKGLENARNAAEAGAYDYVTRNLDFALHCSKEAGNLGVEKSPRGVSLKKESLNKTLVSIENQGIQNAPDYYLRKAEKNIGQFKLNKHLLRTFLDAAKAAKISKDDPKYIKMSAVFKRSLDEAEANMNRAEELTKIAAQYKIKIKGGITTREKAQKLKAEIEKLKNEFF